MPGLRAFGRATMLTPLRPPAPPQIPGLSLDFPKPGIRPQGIPHRIPSQRQQGWVAPVDRGPQLFKGSLDVTQTNGRNRALDT